MHPTVARQRLTDGFRRAPQAEQQQADALRQSPHADTRTDAYSDTATNACEIEAAEAADECALVMVDAQLTITRQLDETSQCVVERSTDSRLKVHFASSIYLST